MFCCFIKIPTFKLKFFDFFKISMRLSTSSMDPLIPPFNHNIPLAYAVNFVKKYSSNLLHSIKNKRILSLSLTSTQVQYFLMMTQICLQQHLMIYGRKIFYNKGSRVCSLKNTIEGGTANFRSNSNLGENKFFFQEIHIFEIHKKKKIFAILFVKW